jgi:hypothetical protein
MAATIRAIPVGIVETPLLPVSTAGVQATFFVMAWTFAALNEAGRSGSWRNLTFVARLWNLGRNQADIIDQSWKA